MIIRRLALGIAVLCLVFSLPISCGDHSVDSIQEIDTQLREILSLPTYEHIYHDIVYIGEEASFLFFTTVDTRLLFSIDVVVKAGYDLTKGLVLIPKNNDSITVALPPAEILLIDADESSIHQYFAKERGSRISRLDYYDEIARQKEVIREDALGRDILYKAEQNGKQLIEKYLQLAGFANVTFRNIPPDHEQPTQEHTDGSR